MNTIFYETLEDFLKGIPIGEQPLLTSGYRFSTGSSVPWVTFRITISCADDRNRKVHVCYFHIGSTVYCEMKSPEEQKYDDILRRCEGTLIDEMRDGGYQLLRGIVDYPSTAIPINATADCLKGII